MSARSHLESLIPADEESHRCCDPESTVEVLADDLAVEVFQTVTAPTTIPELAEECDLATSSAYRKVEKLVEAGLLREAPSSTDSPPPARYERAVEAVTVTLGDELSVACLTEESG